MHVSTLVLVAMLLAVLAPAGAREQTRGGAAAVPKSVAAIEIKNGVTVRGKYVTLLVGTDTQTAAPGGRVSLLVKVSPGPKMHVYAPGQDGYIPVAVSVAPSPAFAARPVVYPPARPYTFLPLGETVKVYDGPFVLRQDIVLTASAEVTQRVAKGDTLAVSGTLAYQACDDKVCYRPETLPIEWKVTIKPVVR